MRTLVLGIGNDILGDDGVGIHIAREIARLAHNTEVDVKETGAAGLNLLELVRGYQRLIITDAILTNKAEAGKIYKLNLEDLAKTDSLLTPHGASLSAMLEIGNSLFPGEMPAEVVVYAVQTSDVEIVTDEMSGVVMASVPEVVRMILDDIKMARVNS